MSVYFAMNKIDLQQIVQLTVMTVRYLLTRFSVGCRSFNVFTKKRNVVHQVTPTWNFA